ncbi:DUF5710 domain-containing protein [Streptomyces sp. WMMC940]|uniref:DUF5710 domain-containing protein n=1 Tax=Streptomyces sp. WMMC940 TaxID=3015153 RepID=UPI0022B608DB|nr:DUF5710 domain-containing protein [Streptomyces sp. WMMC940]MCZ7458227.1 DUF5710 domain-containing protein [Streptomyces sp. WMMC940]
MERVWLDVPFAEKDEAKAHGARWDTRAKRWYSPRPGVPGLRRWAALPEVPDLLPGEDRSFGSGLFVDLVPRSCWFTHVRSCVSPRDWERLRRMISCRADQRCEVCGRSEHREAGRWLEAHERWEYDTAAGVQRLRRLVCLCTDCHATTHFGLAEVRGRREEALAHLRAVTRMSRRQAEAHVRDAFAVWRARSALTWTLDLDILTGAGVEVVRPQPAEERQRIAWRTAEQERRTTASSGGTPPIPSPAAAPLPAPAEVTDAELTEALRQVLGRPATGGGTQWITVPRRPWFCHLCDSDVRPPEIALASVRELPDGAREIVAAPCEWAHVVAEAELPAAHHRAVMAAAADTLSAPGTAASWDADRGGLRVIRGRLADQRQERRRPLW